VTKKLTCLSTIIPAFNEADNIGITISQLAKALSKQPFDYEIIVVDDGSLDGTGIIASEFGADKVIKNDTSIGKGKSISSGIHQASGSIAVLMDADGTFNPDNIPDLISPILQGKADVVIGLRFPIEGISPLQKFGNLLFSLVYKLLFGTKTDYLWSGFQAFRTEDLKELLKYDFKTGIDFSLELRYFAKMKGYKIVEMPFQTRLRKSVGYSQPKSRLFSIKKGLQIMKRVMKEAAKI
jgi:glycosyltransferase involved in cell wall biosynthesis